MTPAWPRFARFDAPRAADRLAEEHGIRLTIDGPCPGGEIGAAYVSWPDGRQSVLTSGPAHPGPLLELARAAGLPVPRYELVAELGTTTIIVQELLPGAPPATLDAALVDQLAALTDRGAGLLAGRPDLASPDLYLITDGPGFCLHRPLATHSRRTARLLDRIHEIGATAAPMTGDDLVHFDYHPGNVLVSGGRVTGVIDWDGAARGDRHFDLVTLQFTLAARAPHLAERLTDRLSAVAEDRLQAYRAHMALRQVDWSIRHHDQPTVNHWLAVAEAALP